MNATIPENESNETNTSQNETYQTYTFNGICKETCLILDGWNTTNLSLEIEIENGTLMLEKIEYKLSVTNDSNKTILNESSEELIQLPAEIGKPVKWIKRIKGEQNFTILPEEASNISVYLGDDKLSDYQVKIRHKNRNFTPQTYEIEKRIKKLKDQSVEQKENLTLELPANNETVEIAYETPGPISKEIISGKKKTVTISSELHYSNITAYADIAKPGTNPRLYWIASPEDYKTYFGETYNGTESQKIIINYDSRFDVKYLDTNNDNLTDRIHLLLPAIDTCRL